MQTYHNTVQETNGDIITTASVYVYLAGTGTLAALKKADESTAIDNPFNVSDDNYDDDGSFWFKAVNGIYDIKIVNGGDTTWKYGRVLFDDANYSAGNGIYNGKMTISQRGDFTSAGVATNAIYYLDRWKTSLTGVTANVQDIGGSLKYTTTSASTGKCGELQFMEKYEVYEGETITVSAKITSNSSDARIVVYDGVDSFSAAHTGSGLEEILSVTATAGSGISTFRVYIYIGGAVAGAAVSIASGDYIEFTDVRLDLGEHRLSGDREYGEELALCQRYYYQITGAVDNFTPAGLGWANSTTLAEFVTKFPVKMRSAPTFSSSGTIKALHGNGISAALTSIGSVGNYHSDEYLAWNGITTGLTLGNVAASRLSDGAYIAFDAEL